MFSVINCNSLLYEAVAAPCISLMQSSHSSESLLKSVLALYVNNFPYYFYDSLSIIVGIQLALGTVVSSLLNDLGLQVNMYC